MVGLIQKMLFQLVREIAGEQAVLAIKKEANVPLDQEYQINNVYSDEEWQRIFAALLKVLNLTLAQAEELYADYFIKDAMRRFPVWFNMCNNSYELLSIQPVIHNCFATSVADKVSKKSIIDKFKIEQFPTHLITHYNSPNKHCRLYILLAQRVIAHYKDEAIIEEKSCLLKGAAECEIHITWNKLGS